MNNSNQSSFYIVNLFFFLMNNSIVVMKMIMIWQDFKKIYNICLPLFFFGNNITWKILIIIHALFDFLKPCMILLP